MSKEMILKTIEILLNDYDDISTINKIQLLENVGRYITKQESEIRNKFIESIKGEVNK